MHHVSVVALKPTISGNQQSLQIYLLRIAFKSLMLLLQTIYLAKHKTKYTYTVSQKKGDTILLSISLLNIDRFSQLFHRRTQLEICIKIINKDPTSPQMCCYTTL